MIWPRWDWSVFQAINGIQSGFLTTFMKLISNVDNWIPFLFLYIIVLLWWGRTRPNRVETGRWKRAFASRNPRIVLLCLVLSTAASDQICYHVKHMVERPRPCFDETATLQVNYRGDVHGNLSFPSAHSANSAALAATTALAYPPLAPFAMLLSFLVGLSRIYLGVHYPVDVLTGWGIGIISATIFWLLFRRMSKRPGLIGFACRFRCRQPAGSFKPPDPWLPVRADSLDGYCIEGYFLKTGDDLAVIVHGLNGSIESMLRPGELLAGLGFSILLVPLRGHDDHPLRKTLGGPAEAYDLAGLLDHTRDRLGFERSRTIVYGSSMGGAVALKVAGLLSDSVAGLMLHGVFMDFFSSSVQRIGRFRTLFLKLFLPAGVRNGLVNFHPAGYVRPWQDMRIVYINGARDRIAPPRTGLAMAGETGGINIVLKGTGHPVWGDCRRMKTPQMKTALKAASDFILRGEGGSVSIDESGIIDDYRGSFQNSTEREK